MDVAQLRAKLVTIQQEMARENQVGLPGAKKDMDSQEIYSIVHQGSGSVPTDMVQALHTAFSKLRFQRQPVQGGAQPTATYASLSLTCSKNSSCNSSTGPSKGNALSSNKPCCNSSAVRSKRPQRQRVVVPFL